MLKESISGQDVIKAIQKEIWNLPVEPTIKVRLTEKTGEAEFRIVEAANESRTTGRTVTLDQISIQ